jgi:hypothetical protein
VGGWGRVLKVLKINCESEESGCWVFVTEIIVNLSLDFDVKRYPFY